MAKKKTIEPTPETGSELRRKLAAVGLTGIVRLAEEMPDLRVTSISTGFPRLDRLVNPFMPGIPAGYDVELYSKKPSDGKSSLALAILSWWQKLGKKIGIIDAERTITQPYLKMLDIAMADYYDHANDRQIYAPVFVRPNKEVIAVEKMLDAVKFLGSEDGGGLDAIMVDSVGVLDTQKNLERDTLTDPAGYGGIAGKLTEFMKSNIAKKATIFWLNQAKQKLSSMPGIVSYNTVGGGAIKFWSGIRFEVARIENIKVAGNADESFGFRTKVLIPKNKMGKDNCSITMTYVPGEGFSRVMDYLAMGQQLGVISKSGAWFQFEDKKFQGEQQLYYAFKNDDGLMESLTAACVAKESQFEPEINAAEEEAPAETAA